MMAATGNGHIVADKWWQRILAAYWIMNMSADYWWFALDAHQGQWRVMVDDGNNAIVAGGQRTLYECLRKLRAELGLEGWR